MKESKTYKKQPKPQPNKLTILETAVQDDNEMQEREHSHVNLSYSTAVSRMKITPRELDRLRSLSEFEDEARKKGYRILAGVDEAGRGPLAGPVVAAACMMSGEVMIAGINDSKKLTTIQREELFQILTTHDKVIYGIGIVFAEEIDRINILQATIQAMRLAINKLSVQPDYLLIDGMSLDYCGVPCLKIIKGDERSMLIASASIIAKVTRDRLMLEMHEAWPEYGFDHHKGYGTQKHIEMIEKYGPCEIHRKTFEPIKSLISTMI